MKKVFFLILALCFLTSFLKAEDVRYVNKLGNIYKRPLNYAKVQAFVSENRSIYESKYKVPDGVRGFLGITMLVANNLDLPKNWDKAKGIGIKIRSIVANSSAHLASLRVTDVILSSNGEKVSNINNFSLLVGKVKPFQKIKFEIYRNGKTFFVDVKLGMHPHDLQRLGIGSKNPEHKFGRSFFNEYFSKTKFWGYIIYEDQATGNTYHYIFEDLSVFLKKKDLPSSGSALKKFQVYNKKFIPPQLPNLLEKAPKEIPKATTWKIVFLNSKESGLKIKINDQEIKGNSRSITEELKAILRAGSKEYSVTLEFDSSFREKDIRKWQYLIQLLAYKDIKVIQKKEDKKPLGEKKEKEKKLKPEEKPL